MTILRIILRIFKFVFEKYTMFKLNKMLNATGISVHTYLNLNFQRTFRILPRFNRRQISWREPVLVDRSLLPSETIHDMRGPCS